MNKQDLKFWTMLGSIFVGMFWWIGVGSELVLSNPDVSEFVDSYRGYGFSIEGILLWLILASILLYPIVVWFCLCFAVLDASLIRQMLFSKGAIWAWLAPITFTLLIVFIVVLRVLASIAAWLFFIGTFGFAIFSVLKSAWGK